MFFCSSFLQHSVISRTEQLQTISDPQSMWKVLWVGHILRGTRFKSARRSLLPFKCELHTSGNGHTATRIANSQSREFQEIELLVMQMRNNFRKRKQKNPSNKTILIFEMNILCRQTTNSHPGLATDVAENTRQSTPPPSPANNMGINEGSAGIVQASACIKRKCCVCACVCVCYQCESIELNYKTLSPSSTNSYRNRKNCRTQTPLSMEA